MAPTRNLSLLSDVELSELMESIKREEKKREQLSPENKQIQDLASKVTSLAKALGVESPDIISVIVNILLGDNFAVYRKRGPAAGRAKSRKPK